MFRRRDPVRDSVTIWFCDRAIEAAADDSVAAALLAAGIACFGRTPVSGAPRAPFCMIGNCFDCLVEIDGETESTGVPGAGTRRYAHPSLPRL